MKKWIFGILALLVVLVIGLVVLTVVFIDVIAKTAIEKGGTTALGVKTSLNSADVGIMSGTFDMSGLKVANPAGFESPHFLSLGGGGVAVTMESLSSETVELPRLALSDIDVHLEKRNGKANYTVILDNLGSAEEGEGEDVKEAKKGGKRFIVREIDIRNINVHVDLLPEAGSLTKVDIPIEAITLKDVGSDQDKGVLLYELSGVIVKAIFAAAVENGGGLIPGDIAGELQNALGELESLSSMGIDMVSEAGAMIEGLGEDVEGAIDEAGKDLENTLKGLNPFGSDSSSDDDDGS